MVAIFEKRAAIDATGIGKGNRCATNDACVLGTEREIARAESYPLPVGNFMCAFKETVAAGKNPSRLEFQRTVTDPLHHGALILP
jgi:hypothetical protein